MAPLDDAYPPRMANIQVTGIAAGGDGIGRMDDGRVVFCEGGLPGEEVEVVEVAARRDFIRARATGVITPSRARIEPTCPSVAVGCGGCPWQHVDPSAQLGLKTDIVRDALRRLARLDPDLVSPGGAVPATAYRTSVRLAVTPDGRPAYRRRGSHDAVEVDQCLVSHPLLEELLVESRLPGAREVLLRVGASSGERLASIIEGRSVSPALPPATAFGPRSAVHEEVAGRTWRVSATSFFQSGPAAASLLVEAVDRAAGSAASIVVDLYAGVGLLGGALADRWGSSRLISVEENASATRDAAVNLADLDATVVRGAVADVGLDLVPDLVIADPARTGLGRPGAAAVAALGAPVVALVSCDPASLARDAGLLTAAGYDLVGVEVLDLFPGTAHLEAVARFDRPGG
jgi:23S rRNA (uracil1939-C5)-methyltransferase